MDFVRVKLIFNTDLVSIDRVDFDRLNDRLRQFFAGFNNFFSFCLWGRTRKVFKEKIYIYKPFVLVNFIDFKGNVLNFMGFYDEFLGNVTNLFISKLVVKNNGILIFNSIDLENKFRRLLTFGFYSGIFDEYRTRLKSFYEFYTGKKLRNDSLLFTVKIRSNKFYVELWGSERMLYLFNALGLINENFLSYGFFMNYR